MAVLISQNVSLAEETVCSSAERAVFLSEFGSLNTFLPDCQKDTFFVFVIFSCHIFHRDTFVGLRCFEQSCLTFID